MENSNNSDSTFLKKLILIISSCCCVCGVAWSGLYYYFFGCNIIFVIPLIFVLLVSISIGLAYFYDQYTLLVYSQIINIMLIPATINWMIGGVAESGGVIIWGFLGPIGALLFLNKRKAVYFLLIFITCSVSSIVFSAIDSNTFREISVFKTSVFFIMNIVTPLIMVYYVTLYFFNNVSNEKLKVLELLTLMQTKNKKISDSINYAKTIQNSILPSETKRNSIFPDSSLFYQPKDTVSGDFYWMKKRDDITYVSVADCTGHGVPGAMMSFICNNALHRAINEYRLTDPGEILNQVNELVCRGFSKSRETVKDGMDISFCALQGDTLLFAGAYNSLYFIRDNNLTELKGTRSPIGFSYQKKKFETQKITLQNNDLIYMTTDGYLDQFHHKSDKKITKKRFKEVLMEAPNLAPKEQIERLKEYYNKWKGNSRQIDDVCVFGAKIQL